MRKRITHGSTFSGIGAPEIAAEMLGWENLFHCEINPFGRSVLDYYYPNAESYEDITKTDFSKWRGKVTILTGGFPCQPFSYAGKRRGSEDDRYLWPHMLRCIEEIRPTWFIGENVAGITTMVFPGEDVAMGNDGTLFGEAEYYRREERYVIEDICKGLEHAGYSVQPMLIPACAVGAPHRRDRIFIIAHRDAENTLHGRCLEREYEDQRCERNIRNSRPGNNERICGEEMAGIAPNSDCGNDVTGGSGINEGESQSEWLQERNEVRKPGIADSLRSSMGKTPSDSDSLRRREIHEQVQSELADGAEPFGNGRERTPSDTGRFANLQSGIRWRTFPTQSPVYRGNDGFPFDVDNLAIPFNKWKTESLKAYGNAIVPQVMYEIFRAIDLIENQE